MDLNLVLGIQAAFVVVILSAMGLCLGWAGARLIRGRSLLPSEKPRRVPWDVFAIAAVLGIYLVLSSVVPSLYSAATGRSGAPKHVVVQKRSDGTILPLPPADPKLFTERDLVAMQSIVGLIIIPAMPLVLWRGWGARLSDLGLERRDLGRNLLRGLFACGLITPVCYGTYLLLLKSLDMNEAPHPVFVALLRDFSWRTIALTSMSALVLAPIGEELFFRGVLFGWLENFAVAPEEAGPGAEKDKPLGSSLERFDDEVDGGKAPRGPARQAIPILVSSFVFAAVHAEQWPAPVPLFLLALVLGTLRRRTGSLWAPIALHAGFNGLATIELVLELGSGK